MKLNTLSGALFFPTLKGEGKCGQYKIPTADCGQGIKHGLGKK